MARKLSADSKRREAKAVTKAKCDWSYIHCIVSKEFKILTVQSLLKSLFTTEVMLVVLQIQIMSQSPCKFQ